MDVVEEIKRRVDLVEFIGRTTVLHKSGRNFRGLCPFHSEKTPSFYVFPDRGSWRCFGSCGEGGDLFSFVLKRENVDFRAALRELAAEAGVELSAESARRRSRLEHLAAIVSVAVDFYQRQLAAEGGQAARHYLLERRGLRADTIAAFHLGWAPDDWRLLRDHLNGRGYSDADAVAAGLLVESESGGAPYDRFRGRVVIPITDERGIFVAMGGRGLAGEEPKYLNSPQTELFDKGGTLFGLNLAASAIRTTGTAVVVEGYMDVIGPWQAGFANVVATMGTSLTEQHVALLRRSAQRIVLAMDPDAAGAAAAERAGSLFLGLDSPERMARSARSASALTAASEVELRVAVLPAGRDPDEVARDDPAAWRQAVDGARPFAEFLVDRLMGPHIPDSPVAARRMVDRLRPVLNAIADPVERAMEVQRVARHLGVAEAAVLERIRPTAGRRTADKSAGEEREAPSPDQLALALLLRHPELRTEMRQLPEDVFNRAIDREVFRRWAAGEELSDLPGDDPVATVARLLNERRLPPLSQEEAARAVKEKIHQITRERITQHQAAVTEALAAAEKRLGATRVAELGAETWRGGLPPEEERELADVVIEDLQLGLSIHRREEPDAV